MISCTVTHLRIGSAVCKRSGAVAIGPDASTTIPCSTVGSDSVPQSQWGIHGGDSIETFQTIAPILFEVLVLDRSCAKSAARTPTTPLLWPTLDAMTSLYSISDEFYEQGQLLIVETAWACRSGGWGALSEAIDCEADTGQQWW